jgi:hypothetical protein
LKGKYVNKLTETPSVVLVQKSPNPIRF